MFRTSLLSWVILVPGFMNVVCSNPTTATVVGPSLDLVTITATVGTVSTDQSLSVLNVMDQSGVQDDWDSYIEANPSLSTTNRRYVVELEFQLPTGVSGSSYGGFILATNTKGPDMSWSPRYFYIFNLITASWTLLGDSTGCQSWVWCYKEFTLDGGVSSYINPTTNRVRVSLESTTKNPDAVNVDYLKLSLLSDSQPPPSPTRTPTKAPTPAPAKVPTLAPTKALTPAPAKVPTRPPSRAPTPAPAKVPTRPPTRAPTGAPTRAPTRAPTKAPTRAPSKVPTRRPTNAPTLSPTTPRPTGKPTIRPTNKPTNKSTPAPTTSLPQTWWQPKASDMLTWQWQLQGTIDTTLNVNMYDIDLFDTSEAVIQQLHSQGKIVVCYFSAGSYEGWRPDWAQYFDFINGSSYSGSEPPFAGKMADWDERWLDIRYVELLRPIMRGRIQMAVDKGCDGVEPDNVDAWTNGAETKVPITAQDQIVYNKMLAEEAHSLGMSIALKNDVDQLEELVDYFDWALNEQCFQYNECNTYEAFVSRNKAVFGVEYTGNPATFCPQAKAMGLSWLKKELALGVWRQGCEDY